MRRTTRNYFYSKADLLELIGLEVVRNNYGLVRRMLKEEIAQTVEYDKKHTFTENEKDLIVGWFRKSA